MARKKQSPPDKIGRKKQRRRLDALVLRLDDEVPPESPSAEEDYWAVENSTSSAKENR